MKMKRILSKKRISLYFTRSKYGKCQGNYKLSLIVSALYVNMKSNFVILSHTLYVTNLLYPLSFMNASEVSFMFSPLQSIKLSSL